MLSAAMSRSPCSTCTRTTSWLSSVVEKTWLLVAGNGRVLLDDGRVDTPPCVSTPMREGRDVEQEHVLHLAVRMTPPWTAAPMATTSSGIHALVRLACPKISWTFAWTRRHACHTADEDHVVDLVLADARRPRNRRLDRARRRRSTRSATSSSSSCARSMTRAPGASGPSSSAADEGQVDVGLGRRRRARASPAPRPPSGAATPCGSLAQIDPVLLLEGLRPGSSTMRISKSSPPRIGVTIGALAPR